jgi:hypothetical protein
LTDNYVYSCPKCQHKSKRNNQLKTRYSNVTDHKDSSQIGKHRYLPRYCMPCKFEFYVREFRALGFKLWDDPVLTTEKQYKVADEGDKGGTYLRVGAIVGDYTKRMSRPIDERSIRYAR